MNINTPILADTVITDRSLKCINKSDSTNTASENLNHWENGLIYPWPIKTVTKHMAIVFPNRFLSITTSFPKTKLYLQ